MKHFFAYIFSAFVLLCSCSKEENGALVQLSSAGPDFLNNEAELIVSLSNRVDFPVSASLSMSKGSIPQSNISFDKVVTIPAGENAKAVKVQIINPDDLEAGDYEAAFTISAVSGANLNSDKNIAILHLKIDAKPTTNNE